MTPTKTVYFLGIRRFSKLSQMSDQLAVIPEDLAKVVTDSNILIRLSSHWVSDVAFEMMMFVVLGKETIESSTGRLNKKSTISEMRSARPPKLQ